MCVVECYYACRLYRCSGIVCLLALFHSHIKLVLFVSSCMMPRRQGYCLDRQRECARFMVTNIIVSSIVSCLFTLPAIELWNECTMTPWTNLSRDIFINVRKTYRRMRLDFRTKYENRDVPRHFAPMSLVKAIQVRATIFAVRLHFCGCTLMMHSSCLFTRKTYPLCHFNGNEQAYVEQRRAGFYASPSNMQRMAENCLLLYALIVAATADFHTKADSWHLLSRLILLAASVSSMFQAWIGDLVAKKFIGRFVQHLLAGEWHWPPGVYFFLLWRTRFRSPRLPPVSSPDQCIRPTCIYDSN